ncbi:MAG: ABC transporter permease [Acidobacteriota bacterium]
MLSFWQDLRYAFRKLMRSPRFTLGAVATLAFTIGANVIVFSVVDAVLLRPLPFPQPDQLVAVDQAGFERDTDGTLEVRDWVAESRALKAVALYSSGILNLAGRPVAEAVRATQVSSSFFSVLGAAPFFGSVPDSRKSEAWRRSVVVSHSLWSRRFGSDPELLGKLLRLNGHAYTVAAIMPAGFDFPERTELWVPASVKRGLFYGGLVFSFIGQRSSSAPAKACR